MNASSLRIRGHARQIRLAGARTSGLFTTAAGYIAACSCGWSSADQRPLREQAVRDHDAHKVDVSSGAYAAAVAAETDRRRTKYAVVLADIDAGRERHLTREQVEAWISELG